MDSTASNFGITINSIDTLLVTLVLFRFLHWQHEHSGGRSWKAVWFSYFNIVLYCAFLTAYLDIIRGFIIYNGVLLAANRTMIDVVYIILEVSNLLLIYFRLKALDMDPKVHNFLKFTVFFHLTGIFTLPLSQDYARKSSDVQTKQLVLLIMAALGCVCGFMSLRLDYVMLRYVWQLKKEFSTIEATKGNNLCKVLFNFGAILCASNVTIGIVCRLIPSLCDPNNGEVTASSKNYEIWYEFARYLTTFYLYQVTNMKMALAKPKQAQTTIATKETISIATRETASMDVKESFNENHQNETQSQHSEVQSQHSEV